MKRLILLSIFFLCSTTFTQADERSSELISVIKAKLKAQKAYRVNFTTEGVTGVLTVSGYRFALISADNEAYYDGRTLWSYNKRDREVNVEDLDPNDPNVMVNPSKLMDVNEGDFSHRSLGGNTVELTPRSTKTVYSKIVLIIDPKSSLPSIVEITDRESGDKGVVTISGFVANPSVSADTFRFDPKKHKGVDVVDFR